jgi:hypothetical protein
MDRKGKIDLLKDVFSILVCSIILFLFLKGCVVNAILNSPYTKKTPARMTKYVNKDRDRYYCYEFIVNGKKYTGSTYLGEYIYGDTVTVSYWPVMPQVNELYEPLMKKTDERND